jgi:gliding motility-associatede transport system auxiliary component
VRILRDYGLGLGALLLVVDIIVATIVPERRGYILGVGAFSLALLIAGLVLNRTRLIATLKGRQVRAAGASAGYILTVVAVLVLVNFLAGRHHIRYDSTANKIFSLSEQTIKVLGSLPRDVKVTAFYQEIGPGRQKLEDLLKEYRSHAPKLNYAFVDPDSNPGEARRYGITEYGTTVVESGKRESRFTTADEEALTNALIKVTQDRDLLVYVTTGHGEHALADGERGGLTLLKEALEKQHYTVKPLVLTQGVPADASLVLIPGPRKPFLPAEAKMIGDDLDRGGRVMLLQDPDTDPGLADVVAGEGLRVRNDVVVDKVSQLFGGSALIPMVAADGYDETQPVTKTFRLQTFFPEASSIEVLSPLPQGVTVTKLAQTSQYSWGETSQAELESGHIHMDRGSDVQGPLTLAAAAVRTVQSPPAVAADASSKGGQDSASSAEQARLLLFGDSDFLSNAYFNASGNGDLALNGIAWLAEQEDLVSIRPKTSVPRVVILSPTQIRYSFWTIVALAPIAITAVGVGVWVRRKRL